MSGTHQLPQGSSTQPEADQVHSFYLHNLLTCFVSRQPCLDKLLVLNDPTEFLHAVASLGSILESHSVSDSFNIQPLSDNVSDLLVSMSHGQGGIKCGNRGTRFLDSEGSHR